MQPWCVSGSPLKATFIRDLDGTTRALPRDVKCKYVTVKVELTCDKMTSGLISAPSAHLWPASEWLR